MKCIVPGTNIKVFGRAVHSLSKIGEELYIEPLDHGLALRTVNSSRSAYACFLFAPSFFQHYDDGAGDVSSQDSEDSLRCKIAMKSILTVFRSLSTMEKTVERCKIKLNMKESRLVFQLHCRHGIVKTHNLAFIECETLQAVFSKDMCPNSLTACSKLLCDAVMNFQNNQEEVTLIVNPEKIILKNYVEDEPDPNKVMHTNLSLEPAEFDYCQIGVDTEVTFCLKELRAILGFSEVTTLPLTLHFETAGRPIVFSIDSDSTFEGNFVLATLADQQSQAPTQCRGISQKSRPAVKHSRSTYSKSSSHNDATLSDKNSRKSNISETSKAMTSEYEEFMNDDTEFEEMMIQNDTTVAVHQSDKSSINTTHNKQSDKSSINTAHDKQSDKSSINTTHDKQSDKSSINTTHDKQSDKSSINTTHDKQSDKSSINTTHDKQSDTVPSAHLSVTARGDNTREVMRSDSPVAGGSKPSEESPVIPILGSKVKFADKSLDESDVTFEEKDDNEEEEEECVPGTPPAKRFRSLFFGSQDSTQSQKKLSTSMVLAADSDEDD